VARVSVVLLSHNYAEFVEEAIASIQAQTFRDFELIVADDGSTDMSVERARAVLDERGEILVGEHVGLERNLERALHRAGAPFLAITSADDRWLPRHLEVGLQALAARPEAGLSYSLLRAIDRAGDPLVLGHSTRRPAFPSGRLHPHVLLPGQFVPTQTTVFRRSAVDAVGGLDPRLHLLELDLIARVAARFGVVFTHETTGEYRVHGNGLSADRSRMLQARLALYEKHLAGSDRDVRGRFVSAAYFKTAYQELVTQPTGASAGRARRWIVQGARVRPRSAVVPLHVVMLAASLLGPLYPAAHRILTAVLRRRWVKTAAQTLLRLGGSAQRRFGAPQVDLGRRSHG
jgi:glycosyltransferase involved in cell wall biosynthesis